MGQYVHLCNKRLKHALVLLWLVARHLSGQVGWVSLHLHSLLLLLPPCWWPLPFWSSLDTIFSLHGVRQQPCFTRETGTAEGCCTTHHVLAQWLRRWTVTVSTQVTGGLTTPSLWYDSQLQQATMNNPIIRIYSAKAVCNACTLQSMLVPSPTMCIWAVK